MFVCESGLFKQHGKVYFEAQWQGAGYKFYVAEGELPMISGAFRIEYTVEIRQTVLIALFDLADSGSDA